MYISDMPSYTVPENLFVPVRLVSNVQMPINISGTDKVLLLACMEHSEYLKMISKDKRKKIEQLLAENCSIDFDFKCIYDMLNNFFKDIYTL